MKQLYSLVALMLALSVSWVSAEEASVKVSSDRAAVIQFVDSNPADADVAGSLKTTIDFKAGKGGLIGDLILSYDDDAGMLKGARAGLYTRITNSSGEIVGFADAKIKPDEGVKGLDVKAEAVASGDQSAADFKMTVLRFDPEPDLSSMSGDGKFSGDFKKLTSSGKFKMAGSEIGADELQFKDLSFTITEHEADTTIAFEAKVPTNSPMASQLGQLPGLVPMLEGQLQQVGVTVKDVEFPDLTEEGDLTVATGKLTLVGLRDALRPFLGFGIQQFQADMGPDVDVKQAFEDMLELRMDKFHFELNADSNEVAGTFEVNLSDLESFYSGYLTLLPGLQRQSNEDLAREAGAFGPLVLAFSELNTERAVKAIKVAVESNLKVEGSGDFSLDQTDDEAKLIVNGNILTTNYSSYVTKAREEGLPVTEEAVAKLDIKLDAEGKLDSDLYFYADGQLIDYYKKTFAKAAERSGAEPDVVEALEKLSLDMASFKLDMEDNKVTLLGQSETSDLTTVAKYFLSMYAPEIDADLTGVAIDLQMPQGENSTVDLGIFFANFLPGLGEGEVREVLGLGTEATVVMDAPAGDVQLVAVDTPEIKVDGKLASVQDSGKQLLASSPADIAGGGAGGGNNWGLIGLGALLLVGVGGFLMRGKK